MGIVNGDISQGIEVKKIPVQNNFDEEIPKCFQYVKTNIPGPLASIEDFESLLDGCKDTGCSTDNCMCLQVSLGPSFTPGGKIAEIPQTRQTQKPVIECNRRCKCRDTCPNRVVQNGVCVGLGVFRTENKGWGLRLEEPLVTRGTFVCEYAGEVIGHEEALRRILATDKGNSMNYLHVLREHVSSGKLILTYVDPENTGNVGRYLNHSCEPNLTMVPVRVEHLVPRLCLFASRDIRYGEELTFDYSGGEDQEVKGEAERRKICNCEAKICKKFLPYEENLFANERTGGIFFY